MALNTEFVKIWLKKSYINFLEVQIIELELEVDGAWEQYIKNLREQLKSKLASTVDPSTLMSTLREIEAKSIDVNRELILARKTSPQRFYEALVEAILPFLSLKG